MSDPIMYCPTCGTRLAKALTYCNHCGANLRKLFDGDEPKVPTTSVDNLIYAIVGTTITFLGMSLGALVLMKDGTIDAGMGAIFVTLSFIALVVVEGILVWRLLYFSKGAKERRGPAQSKDTAAQEPDAAGARALGEPAPSITEQTTRTFEPSRREDDQR